MRLSIPWEASRVWSSLRWDQDGDAFSEVANPFHRDTLTVLSHLCQLSMQDPRGLWPSLDGGLWGGAGWQCALD